MREYHIHELKNIEEEIRNISHELSLDTFNSEVGYITIVQNLLRDQSKISNFKYEIRNDSEIVWEEIESAIKINLFRIIQEAIQNINKYAEAKIVKLNFDKLLDHLELTIEDDGKGFKLSKSRKGIGIKNMRSRAHKMRGKITINSRTNRGTTIHVVVPF
jgi:signal transduction histidine kinase